jgi:hypothetical protein
MITKFLPEDKVVWKQYKDYDLYIFSNDFQVKYLSEEEQDNPVTKEDTIDYDVYKYINLYKNKKLAEIISLRNLHKKLFPEYYANEEDEKLFYMQKDKDIIRIPLNVLNKFVYPNKILQIYDTTDKNTTRLKHSKKIIQTSNKKVYPHKRNGNITLKRGHKYIALGTLTYVKFDKDTLIPKNNRAYWCENPVTIWKQKTQGKKTKTGIWD